MTDETAFSTAPLLLGAHPALDFLNCRVAPGGGEMDWLAVSDGLAGWAAHALPQDATGTSALPGTPELDRVTRRALDLHAWLGGFVAAHAGHPLGPVTAEELDPLNRILAEDDAYLQLVPVPDAAPGGVAARSVCRLGPGPALLQSLAERAVDLLLDADFARIRQCEAKACQIWFLDTTKNATRRWCSMAICGNRAKAAQHRARLAARRNRTDQL